jgi:hypothetical protein
MAGTPRARRYWVPSCLNGREAAAVDASGAADLVELDVLRELWAVFVMSPVDSGVSPAGIDIMPSSVAVVVVTLGLGLGRGIL